MASTQTSSAAPPLVLASTSRYRRALLERFGLTFTSSAPQVDETAKPDEDPIELVQRLARAKAQAVAERFPKAVIIGSDQLAVRGRVVLGKPGSIESCIQQLKDSSGQRVIFHTGVHILNTKTGSHEAHVDQTTVIFRTLTDKEIERYVAAESPLDCAGGFKAEALGITLFDRIDSQDPTALTGLPLIWVAKALRRAGVLLP